jgi:exopolyphosphatase/guanosine-5'-triphosphate,3'-diphosphate pyrophosphatase
MHLTGYPLPVIHQYPMSGEHVARLGRTISHLPKGRLREIANLSPARLPTLSDATALLSVTLKQLGSTETVVSAFGLREGLLFSRLSPQQRREDPLIAAARDEGERLGRFPEHGDLLNDWITPLFGGEDDEMARLRHAACLLADVGWRANPEFRAERGLEIALHGNWVAIDGRGRALLAQALFTCLGGGLNSPDPLTRLANNAELDRAKRWGLAMRLGQRLSGGVAAPLDRSRLELGERAVRLCLDHDDAALYGEAVERRHKALATSFAREAVLLL